MPPHGFLGRHGRSGPRRAADPALDTYVNPRFAYAVTYPRGVLLPQGEAENGDGQRFVSPDGRAVLAVWGSHNALNQTLLSHHQDAVRDFGGRVTYQALRPDWYVFSGIRQGRIFYQKTLFRDDIFKTFTFTYDATQRHLYDRIAAAISKSFQHR